MVIYTPPIPGKSRGCQVESETWCVIQFPHGIEQSHSMVPVICDGLCLMVPVSSMVYGCVYNPILVHPQLNYGFWEVLNIIGGRYYFAWDIVSRVVMYYLSRENHCFAWCIVDPFSVLFPKCRDGLLSLYCFSTSIYLICSILKHDPNQAMALVN